MEDELKKAIKELNEQLDYSVDGYYMDLPQEQVNIFLDKLLELGLLTQKIKV